MSLMLLENQLILQEKCKNKWKGSFFKEQYMYGSGVHLKCI